MISFEISLILVFLLVTTTSNILRSENYNCNLAWPSLELFLPISLSYSKKDPRYYESEILFFRSFLLFWPFKASNTSLKMIIDIEKLNSKAHHDLMDTVNGIKGRIIGGVNISTSMQSIYYKRGSDRQQLDMLWADNYTNKEYVGFVDTDTVFLTYIDREDLFEDGKPVINGRSGPHNPDDVWAHASRATYKALGILEPMRCMSYFPVIIKTSHLRDLREYMIKFHSNRLFNEIFLELSTNSRFSQFNIICAYLFTFKRNDYIWYVHPMVSSNWNGTSPLPNLGQITSFDIFNDSKMFEPKPRIATHARYRSYGQKYMGNIIKYREHFNLLLQGGVCISPSVPHIYRSICNNNTFVGSEKSNGIQPLGKLGYYEEMHIFEYFDYTKTNSKDELKRQYNNRNDRIIKCSHEWDLEELKVIMKPLNEMKNNGWS